jgi:hypothetical protein
VRTTKLFALLTVPLLVSGASLFARASVPPRISCTITGSNASE